MTTTSYATTCKFCKKPLVLQLDSEYADLGDPHKLIPLAACNRCADLRVHAREALSTIAGVCNNLLIWKAKHGYDEKTGQFKKAFDSLIKNTRRFAESLAALHNSKRMVWLDEFAHILYDRPERWGDIIQKYRKDCATDYANEQAELRATHPDP